eukprot:5973200-Prorocentrum_lima.AAC.1
MGVYPIQQKSWYLAHYHGKQVKPTMTKSCSAEKRFWYCACCGEKYEPDKHLKDRLLIIVPPSSR